MKNNLELYVDKILNLPLWVKQSVYFSLGNHLKKNKCDIKNPFLNFVPTLTFKGKSELADRKCGFDNNFYNFLKLCENGYNLPEISMSTFFSMEETAKYFAFCVEQGFLDNPSNEITDFAEFISGKCRLGEYLVKINLITSAQLENILSLKDNKKIGEKLIKAGFIKSDDIESLLILKDEAQRRFVPDYNSIPRVSSEFCNDTKRFEKEISDLKEENVKLKIKMQQLLQLVRENGKSDGFS